MYRIIGTVQTKLIAHYSIELIQLILYRDKYLIQFYIYFLLRELYIQNCIIIITALLIINLPVNLLIWGYMLTKKIWKLNDHLFEYNYPDFPKSIKKSKKKKTLEKKRSYQVSKKEEIEKE